MKLRDALREKGLNISQLAVLVGAHQTSIGRVIQAQEKLKRWGSPELLWDIAEAMYPHCDIKELLFPWKFFGDKAKPVRQRRKSNAEPRRP